VERDGNLAGWLVLALLVAALIVVGAVALAQDGDGARPERPPGTTTVEVQTNTEPQAETETAETETAETETNEDTGTTTEGPAG
jgi:hypothetical protein